VSIRAVIFDMDGVLIDAREWHYEALNKALGLFGYSISRHEHLVTYDGLPTRKKLEMLTIERGLPTGLHAFIHELKQIYTMQLIVQQCRPQFQHEYALSRLRAEEYRLAVASNAIRDTVEEMLTRSNLLGYLELFLSNQDVHRPKPDPEIYQIVMQRLRMEPEECLVVEDNVNGIKAAQAAGAHVMAVESPLDAHYDNIRYHIDKYDGKST